MENPQAQVRSVSALTQAETVIKASGHVKEAAEHLVRSARFFSEKPADYVAGAREALRSVQQSYEAILAWHGFPVEADMTLNTLAESAGNAVSMLRTSHKRALHLESLVATFTENEEASVNQREGAVTGYFTARNTLSVVVGSLPQSVVKEAIPLLNKAESIRTGREIAARDTTIISRRQPVYPTTRRRANGVSS